MNEDLQKNILYAAAPWLDFRAKTELARRLLALALEPDETTE